MHKSLLPLALLFAFGAVSAHADIILSATVNTQSLAGTTGYVDFQFNPGPLSTQSATLKVENFTGAAYVAGSQTDVGGATGGPLPGTVTLTNSSIYNDDNEGVKFGNIMTFTLDFSGLAISSPSGTALSGSSFAFSLFDSTDTNPLLTNDPNGFAAVVNVNTNGTVTVSVPSSDVVVPEPASMFMLSGGLVLIGILSRKRLA